MRDNADTRAINSDADSGNTDTCAYFDSKSESFANIDTHSKWNGNSDTSVRAND